MRYLIVTYGMARIVADFVTEAAAATGETFDSDLGVCTDSEALHRFLCRVDPGNEYSVKFSNRKPRQTHSTHYIFG